MKSSILRLSRMSENTSENYNEEAIVMGYMPFVRLSPLDVLTLREIHGQWIFDELMIHLRDPLKLHRDWAVLFCATAAMIPRDLLQNPDTIHDVVTSHPAFRDRKSAYKQFQRVYFGRIWKRAKDPCAQFSSLWERRVVRADYERVRSLLEQKATKRNDAIKLSKKRPVSVQILPNRKSNPKKPAIVMKKKPAVID